MRKAYFSTLTLILGLAFVMAPLGVFACGGDKTGTTSTTSADNSSVNAQYVGAGSGCDASKTGTTSANAATVNSKYAGADKAACTVGNKAACGAKTGTTSADANQAETSAKFASATFNVSGMTCNGCVNKVTSALKNTDGVKSVDKVDYKTGTAMVTYDASDVSCPSKLAKVITDAGFNAEVVPAVATSADGKTMNINAPGCTPADMAACAAKCANMTEAEKAACAAKCAGKANTTSGNTETKTSGSM